MDQKARHYKRMRSAIWLFLYLLLNADRRTGFLVRKVRTISSDMGINRDTVLRWLNILRKEGYVVTENTGRCLSIQIKKWKGVLNVGNMSHQRWQISNSRGWKIPTPQKSRNPLYLSQKLPNLSYPNDITIKRDILNNDIEDKNSLDSNDDPFKGFRPKTREELLALDLAEALKDYQALALYLSYVKKYPEWVLRKVLGEVKEIPIEKIKKSKGALFNYLIQKYDQA